MKLLKSAALCAVYLILAYLTAYGLCWLLLLADDFTLFTLLYLVGALTPALFALSGYFAPPSVRSTALPRLALILALFALLPAAAIGWGEHTGNALVWMLDMPHRMTAIAYFSALFNSPQSAFVLNVLQPIFVAVSNVLMVAGFALGLFVRHQNSRKE